MENNYVNLGFIYAFNYEQKLKEIEFSAGRCSREVPKFVKPLSVKLLFL